MKAKRRPLTKTQLAKVRKRLEAFVNAKFARLFMDNPHFHTPTERDFYMFVSGFRAFGDLHER